MFSAQSLLAGNGASVTSLRKSREPITALNVATYVTPLVVRNFWLCKASKETGEEIWLPLYLYGDKSRPFGSCILLVD